VWHYLALLGSLKQDFFHGIKLGIMGRRYHESRQYHAMFIHGVVVLNIYNPLFFNGFFIDFWRGF